jgi:hypothetical protein
VKRTPDRHINAGEYAVLVQIARGETVQGAANRCGCTLKAATGRLYRARIRVGAASTAHLIALCIADRQIPAGVATGSEVDR